MQPIRMMFIPVACLSFALATCLLEAQPVCEPLPPPSGPTIEVDPSEASNLADIVYNAPAGTTILLQDGLYPIVSGLQFHTPNVTMRSISGRREFVVLDASYSTDAGELIMISASDVTIADLTLRRAYYHLIHIWDDGSVVEGVLLHNLHLEDPAEQAVKVNPSNGGYVDNSTIECCRIDLTDAGRLEVRNNCYTGGIDVHQGWGWVVRRNRIEGFWCDSGLSEHGIHFWKGSRDTLVEQNRIQDCARGIGFGLGETGTQREYPDDPYPEVEGHLGHIDGIIRNNFVSASDPGLFASEYSFDSGIAVEQAHGVKILHNSVASSESPVSSSIEYRFTNTLAYVANNLATYLLLNRSAPAPIAIEEGNLSSVSATFFLNVPIGDLHLSQTGAASAEDAGVFLADGCEDDFDAELRDSEPDIGADEFRQLIFSDGFESGRLDAWN